MKISSGQLRHLPTYEECYNLLPHGKKSSEQPSSRKSWRFLQVKQIGMRLLPAMYASMAFLPEPQRRKTFLQFSKSRYDEGKHRK